MRFFSEKLTMIGAACVHVNDRSFSFSWLAFAKSSQFNKNKRVVSKIRCHNEPVSLTNRFHAHSTYKSAIYTILNIVLRDRFLFRCTTLPSHPLLIFALFPLLLWVFSTRLFPFYVPGVFRLYWKIQGQSMGNAILPEPNKREEKIRSRHVSSS